MQTCLNVIGTPAKVHLVDRHLHLNAIPPLKGSVAFAVAGSSWGNIPTLVRVSQAVKLDPVLIYCMASAPDDLTMEDAEDAVESLLRDSAQKLNELVHLLPHGVGTYAYVYMALPTITYRPNGNPSGWFELVFWLLPMVFEKPPKVITKAPLVDSNWPLKLPPREPFAEAMYGYTPDEAVLARTRTLFKRWANYVGK